MWIIELALTLLFVVLRACGNIDWAWYWILSPILIGEFIGFIALLARHP